MINCCMRAAEGICFIRAGAMRGELIPDLHLSCHLAGRAWNTSGLDRAHGRNVPDVLSASEHASQIGRVVQGRKRASSKEGCKNAESNGRAGAPYRLIPMSQSPEFESRLGDLADVFGHVIEFPTLLSATTHAYVWICQLLLRQAIRDVAQLYQYPLVREKDQHESLACSVDECAINLLVRCTSLRCGGNIEVTSEELLGVSGSRIPFNWTRKLEVLTRRRSIGRSCCPQEPDTQTLQLMGSNAFAKNVLANSLEYVSDQEVDLSIAFILSSIWNANVKCHVIVTFYESHAKGRRDELLHARVAASATASRASAPTAPSTTPTTSSAGCRSFRLPCPVLSIDVLPFFDLGYMFGHRCICTDAVGIHESDQLRLGQIARRAGLTFLDLSFCGLKYFALLEVRKRLAARPLIIWIHI
ncbi:hypothetical protein KC325_g130 [Hortaea werneckii]|nr:hypothetical protein KC325_g130 [Hortaea werneckii]